MNNNNNFYTIINYFEILIKLLHVTILSSQGFSIFCGLKLINSFIQDVYTFCLFLHWKIIIKPPIYILLKYLNYDHKIHLKILNYCFNIQKLTN